MIGRRRILFIFLLCLYHSFSKRYDNYTLYRGIPMDEYQLRFLQDLQKKYDVNFWREPGTLNKSVDFVINPSNKLYFEKDASENGLYLTTILENVQTAFDLQTVKSYIRRRTDSFGWDNYYKIEDIYSWLNDLSTVNPDIMKIITIGKTSEGREIWAVSIILKDPRTRRKYGTTIKKKVILEGGIHAREWISIAFVTYMINAVCHAATSNNFDLKRVAYMYEWYFVPVLNPDGYEYTHTKDRMWRKNRRNGNSGVDLNRNFEYKFGTNGVSRDATSEIYCGDSAFSEAETEAMSNFVLENSQNLQYYMSFHAYGQYLIIPYADSKYHKENFDEMYAMGKEAAKKLYSIFKTKYTVGTAFDTVGYTTTGISGDWVKSTFRIPYVCTFELRDSGRYGFALPPNQIQPTCLETMEAVTSLLSSTRSQSGEQNDQMTAGQESTFMDKIVVICNVIWFITVRFGY